MMRGKILLAILLSPIWMIAQNNNSATQNLTVKIPRVSLLDIEGDHDIILGFKVSGNNEAGMSLSPLPNNQVCWLNYSTITSTAANTYSITAQLDKDSDNVDIKLSVSPDGGHGGGKLGAANSSISLKSSPTTIISNIGSAYTGNGANNGHQLRYSIGLKNSSLKNIETGDSNYKITYTILEN